MRIKLVYFLLRRFSKTSSLWATIALVLVLSSASIAQMKFPITKEGGVYFLPVVLGGNHDVDFVIDSGAAEVSIPLEVAKKRVLSASVLGMTAA